MGDIRTKGDAAWRDFATDGEPSSGVHRPIKSEIRALFGVVEDAVTASAAGYVFKATLSELNGDLDHPAETRARVDGDATSANNGDYIKVGASGAGSWSRVDMQFALQDAIDALSPAITWANLFRMVAPISAIPSQGDHLTIGGADGGVVFDVGPEGVDFRLAPSSELAGDIAALRALRDAIKFVPGESFTVGTAAGDVMADMAATSNSSGIVYETTVGSLQQVAIATGAGSTVISDDTANDRFPQLVGSHVRFASDRYNATLREMRMLIDGKSVVSALGSQKVYFILALGQSTSIGSNSAGGLTAITTAADYIASVLRFNKGTRPIGETQTVSGDGQNLVVPAANIDRLVPLTATADSANYAETHLETLAYRLHENGALRSIVCAPGIGGASYAQLKEGTQPYLNALAVVSRAQAIISELGWNMEVIVTWDQGEANASDSAAATKANIEELYADLKRDLGDITGQSDLHFFLAQTSALNQSGVPIGQWLAGRDNPNIYCVGPRYQLPYSDAFHFTSAGYAMLGDLYYRAIKAVVVDGGSYTPLQPISAVRSAATIDLLFEGQTGAVVQDTTNVPAATNWGLEYFDDTSSASISSVAAITGGVRVTLNTTPTGANPILRGAWTRPGTVPAADGIARTNIADEDTLTATTDASALPNHCVHFEINVTT